MTEVVASIIIPTHNRDVLLAKALNSALAQSIQDIEVIVIDDACDDQTRDILALFGEIDDRLKVLTLTSPLGISGGLQRNRAVQVARGKYICYLDDDDEMTFRAVEKRVEFLESRPDLDFCWGASFFLRNVLPQDEWRLLCRRRLVAEFDHEVDWTLGTIIPNELMHRAGVVGESGVWWTPMRGEDRRLVKAMIEKGFKGEPLDYPVAIYGRHAPFDPSSRRRVEVIRTRAAAAQRKRMEAAGKKLIPQTPVIAPRRVPEDIREKIEERSTRSAVTRAQALRLRGAQAAPVALPQVREADETAPRSADGEGSQEV